LGHAQAAAGVLGVMKIVLALEHERLPKTLHAETPSPHIEWEGSGLALLQSPVAWQRDRDRVRRAGISSFGISGTNAHVVLQEAPSPSAAVQAASPVAASLPLLVSGRDEVALRTQATRWAAWLLAHPETDWSDLVRTAALHRTHFETGAALQVSSVAEASEALTALAEGSAHRALSEGQASPRGSVAFVFPGHGSQWAAMGRDLLASSPAFAEAVAACDAALYPHTGFSMEAVLRGDEGDDVPPLDRVDVVQPALFAMGIGLAAAWRSLGLEPAAVLGHSVGEIAAAVVSGALSLAEGAQVVAVRGRLIAAVDREGAMLSVPRPASELAEWIAPFADTLTVAVVNAPDSAVVSGDTQAILELQSSLAAEGITGRRVNIGFAAHSAHMDGVSEKFGAALVSLRPNSATVPFYSSVTGMRMDGATLDAAYW
ncbi:MAG: type I polyketide synthase, partial [Delftia sp.]|nr:type I polyketide synthase [Delftia sp.]